MEQLVAFLLFDLDKFKAINDGHGHAMGDRVLRLFAHTLSANLPRDSIAGRLGGEEFAALVSGPDQQATIATAERLRETFAAAARVVDGVPIAPPSASGSRMRTTARPTSRRCANAPIRRSTGPRHSAATGSRPPWMSWCRWFPRRPWRQASGRPTFRFRHPNKRSARPNRQPDRGKTEEARRSRPFPYQRGSGFET